MRLPNTSKSTSILFANLLLLAFLSCKQKDKDPVIGKVEEPAVVIVTNLPQIGLVAESE